MSYLAETELDAAIREVMKRAVIDPEFRALAVKDGNMAISKASGKSLPKGTAISFLSNYGAAAKSFVLPDPVGDPDLLTEEALEQVAGGLASCEASSCGTSHAD